MSELDEHYQSSIANDNLTMETLSSGRNTTTSPTDGSGFTGRLANALMSGNLPRSVLDIFDDIKCDSGSQSIEHDCPGHHMINYGEDSIVIQPMEVWTEKELRF